MARLTPTSYFKEIFPDRIDFKNPGNYLCRFCGKSTIESRRRFYCSDRCYDLCQKAVSWFVAKRTVWIRDKRKCVKCGKPLLLNNRWWNHEEGETAECHHVTPVKELYGVAWDSVSNEHWRDIPKQTVSFWYCKFYVLLYLDTNNLITLCPLCHVKIHRVRAQKPNPFRVKRTWKHFWKITAIRSLEDYIKPTSS